MRFAELHGGNASLARANDAIFASFAVDVEVVKAQCLMKLVELVPILGAASPIAHVRFDLHNDFNDLRLLQGLLNLCLVVPRNDHNRRFPFLAHLDLNLHLELVLDSDDVCALLTNDAPQPFLRFNPERPHMLMFRLGLTLNMPPPSFQRIHSQSGNFLPRDNIELLSDESRHQDFRSADRPRGAEQKDGAATWACMPHAQHFSAATAADSATFGLPHHSLAVGRCLRRHNAPCGHDAPRCQPLRSPKACGSVGRDEPLGKAVVHGQLRLPEAQPDAPALGRWRTRSGAGARHDLLAPDGVALRALHGRDHQQAPLPAADASSAPAARCRRGPGHLNFQNLTHNKFEHRRTARPMAHKANAVNRDKPIWPRPALERANDGSAAVVEARSPRNDVLQACNIPSVGPGIGPYLDSARRVRHA
mmetsp:Transcript_7444/g.27292  ORF Transcript_7444/g.27292 Transcript_7444/m.27292 type:complete len:420 (+) Transcript_7444:189-1448(+)